MQDIIFTERLTLKPVTREETRMLSESQAPASLDTSDLQASIDAHPDILTETKELKRVLDIMASMYDRDVICCGVFLNDEMIGFVNIVHPGGTFPLLQYEIKKDFQRRGFGHEAVSGFLQEYWKTWAEPVFALIRPTNTVSIALIKKLGGTLVQPKSLLEELLISTYRVS